MIDLLVFHSQDMGKPCFCFWMQGGLPSALLNSLFRSDTFFHGKIKLFPRINKKIPIFSLFTTSEKGVYSRFSHFFTFFGDGDKKIGISLLPALKGESVLMPIRGKAMGERAFTHRRWH